MPHPTDPATLQGALVLKLWALNLAFETRLGEDLRALDLTTAGFRLVGELMRAPEGLRQKELARCLGVRPPTVSAAVDRLERQGVLYRVRDADDPRAWRVHLSPDAPLGRGVALLLQLEQELFGGLCPGERDAADALLQHLLHRLQGPPGSSP